jgi:transposase InsO family protein
MASTRENEFLSRKEFAHYEEVSERTVGRWLQTNKIPAIKIEGKGHRKGHLENRIHYTQLSNETWELFLSDRGLLPEAKAESLSTLEPWQRERMLKREARVKEYLDAVRDIPQGKKGAVQKQLAKIHGISTQTLRRHTRNYLKGGRGTLVPAWNPGRQERVLTKEMKKFIDGEYMQPLGPSKAEVHENLIVAFKDKCSKLPTYHTVADYINKKWPKGQQLLVRDKEEWDRRYSPHVRRDWKAAAVNEVWVGDAKQIDVACLFRGKAIFPWYTAFLDARSRKFVGGVLTPTPDADAIGQTAVISFREHGTPQVIYLDRGKAFKAHRVAGEKIKEERITPFAGLENNRIVGIFQEMGVEIFWAAPYNAREKIIEPAFKIFTYRLRGLPGYRGHNTKTRPKKLMSEIRAGKLLSLEELSAKIDEIINKRNARPHSTTGEIPNALYEGYTPVIPSTDLLNFLLLDVHRNKVRDASVTVDGLLYRHEDLFKIAGEEVEVRRDPKDVRQAAIIYKGEPYCVALLEVATHYRDPITLASVKEARKIRRKARRFRQEIIEQKGYIEDPVRLAMQLQEEEKERAIGREIRPVKAKITTLHKKQRLAKGVVQGLKEAPSRAEGRGKIAKLPQEDSLEDKIKRGLFGT